MAVAQLYRGADDDNVRVASVVARHERTLVRIARQASLCDDDALDAYQRALEIFVRRAATVDPATEVAWLKVVVRHEALAIRRTRADAVSHEDVDLDSVVESRLRSVEDQVISSDRVRKSAEALRSLKPDEANALLLKAQGLSYEEIAAQKGWTYTKVNRAITEGRRRFMQAYEDIETGQECERFRPIVFALARGEASAAQVAEIRPHLRHCSSCRATTRRLRFAWLRRTAMAIPFLGWISARRAFASAHARLAKPGAGRRGAAGDEIGPSSGSSLDRPQVALDAAGSHELTEPGAHVSRAQVLKQELYALLHRANSSDVAVGIHAATTSGSSRLATAAAVLGICVSGASVGTACVVSGLLATPPQQTPPHKARDRAAKIAAVHTPSSPTAGKSDDGQQTATASEPPVDSTVVSEMRQAQSTRRSHTSIRSKRTARARQKARRTAAEHEFGFEQSTAPSATPAAVVGSSQTATAQSSAATGESAAPSPRNDPAQMEFGP